jgi:hypothetical protein
MTRLLTMTPRSKINPKLATSLYGRGIAKLRKGDRANANTDILTAKQIEPNVAEEFARYGLTAEAMKMEE